MGLLFLIEGSMSLPLLSTQMRNRVAPSTSISMRTKQMLTARATLLYRVASINNWHLPSWISLRYSLKHLAESQPKLSMAMPCSPKTLVRSAEVKFVPKHWQA